jgi:hypothetical protein
MLSGRLAFEGDTVGEVLGGIFKSEPDWSRLPASLPSDIYRLIRRCLRKNSISRFKDARGYSASGCNSPGLLGSTEILLRTLIGRMARFEREAKVSEVFCHCQKVIKDVVGSFLSSSLNVYETS